MSNRASVVVPRTNGVASGTGGMQTASTVASIKVALAGQPNVGKSTVFNVLTGLSQHVGNWPGKTVEQKTGIYCHGDVRLELVDLPGAYSLTSASEEERIARDYIIKGRPDVVVLVADAASLERNLYLLAELLLLPAPIILALNMMDVAKQQGLVIDADALSRALGLPVVPMSASRNQGVRELVEEIRALTCDPSRFHPNRPTLRPDHRQTMAAILELVRDHVPAPYEPEWVAVKLLEGDSEVTGLARSWLPPEAWERVSAILLQHEDAILDIAGGRYEWILSAIHQAVSRPGLGPVTFTERLDRWATHPLWGLLMLLGASAVVFLLVFSVGSPLQGLLDQLIVQGLGGWIRHVLTGAPYWLSGLLADGVIGGAGTVLTFTPILAIFFVALGLLEDTGYMARAAFVMDRFMHVLGLHGRSFLPLLLGFGCNVPAVMGARVVDSRRGRLITIMLAPLVPCAARLGLLATLAVAFFGPMGVAVTVGLVGLNLAVLAAGGVLLDRVLLPGEQTAFIMELPFYHTPNWRTIGLFVWHNLRAFLQRAGTIILVASLVVWALANLPSGDIATSYLAWVGRSLSPLGRLMGLNWRGLVALLASFVAKENGLATLAVVYGTNAEGSGLGPALRAAMSPASALAFLVAQMLFVPCLATVAVIRQETGSWKWTLGNVLMLFVLSILGGATAYHLARLFGM